MGYDLRARGERTNAYRLSVHGMEIARDALLELGVLDELAEARRPLDDAGRAARSLEHDAVPLYKLCSNEGWVITAEEASWIAATLEASVLSADTGPAAQLLRDFGAFNRAMVERGGYEVW